MVLAIYSFLKERLTTGGTRGEGWRKNENTLIDSELSPCSGMHPACLLLLNIRPLRDDLVENSKLLGLFALMVSPPRSPRSREWPRVENERKEHRGQDARVWWGSLFLGHLVRVLHVDLVEPSSQGEDLLRPDGNVGGLPWPSRGWWIMTSHRQFSPCPGVLAERRMDAEPRLPDAERELGLNTGRRDGSGQT